MGSISGTSGTRAAGVSFPATDQLHPEAFPSLVWAVVVFLQLIRTQKVGAAAKMVPETIGPDSAGLVAVKYRLQKYKRIFKKFINQ